jgi:phosphoglucosamine mutase
LIDEEGNVIDGDFIMAMIALHLKNRNKLLKNTVVITPMSNLGLWRCLQQHDITLVQANVGDRYVVEKMRDSGFNFGGEQSGHIIFLDYATTGDGIIAALQVLSFMVESQKPLSELSRIMSRFPQVLNNIKVREKKSFEDIRGFSRALQRIESELGDSGRVLVRYSGTELLARVMIEGEDKKIIDEYAKELSEIISREIGG